MPIYPGEAHVVLWLLQSSNPASMWPRPLSQPFPNRRRGRSDSVPLSPATNGTAKRVETKGHGSDHNAAYFPSVMYNGMFLRVARIPLTVSLRIVWVSYLEARISALRVLRTTATRTKSELMHGPCHATSKITCPDPVKLSVADWSMARPGPRP